MPNCCEERFSPHKVCGLGTAYSKGNIMNNKSSWHTLSYVSAFLMGVILFWSVGKDWLDLESALVFLAGLIGVAVAVLAFAGWKIYYNSHHKEN